MTNQLIPIGDIERMAQAIAKSGLFGIQRPDQAVALMLIAQAEGLHPAVAARDYHIIQGRPALKADTILARFQASGGKVEWQDYTDEVVSATFSHPQGGTVSVAWDMARAKAACLTGKDNWKKYPRQMLRARVISEGVRTCFPAVCIGVYTPEEVSDFDSKPEREPEPINKKPINTAPVIVEPMPEPEDAEIVPETPKPKRKRAAKKKTEEDPAPEEHAPSNGGGTAKELGEANTKVYSMAREAGCKNRQEMFDIASNKLGRKITDFAQANIMELRMVWKTFQAMAGEAA